MHQFTIDKSTAPNAYRNHFWENLQLIGLESVGVPVIRKKLLYGGYVNFQSDGEPFTGKEYLIVNYGGLRNKEVSPKLKKLFKNRVKTALMADIKELGDSFSGKLVLHFAEGVLQRVEIIAN